MSSRRRGTDVGDRDILIKGFIEFVLKNRGLIEAQAGLKGTGQAAEDAGKKLKKTESSAAALGSTLRRWLGSAAITALVRTSLLEFAKLERSFNALRIQMDGIGKSADAELPRVKKFLEEIRAGGGGLLTETVPAFQRFLGLTGDVEAALALVKLASNIAESGMSDLGGAVDVLSSVIVGRAARSLKDFGINIQQAEDGTVNAREALELLIKKFPDAVSEIDDLQNRLDKAGGAWERFSTSAGSAINSVVNGLDKAGVRIAEGIQRLFPFEAAAFRATFGEAEKAGEKIGQSTEKGLEKSLAVADKTDELRRKAKLEKELKENKERVERENARRLREMEEEEKQRKQTEDEHDAFLLRIADAQQKHEDQILETKRQRLDTEVELERALLEEKLNASDLELQERLRLEEELAKLDLKRKLRSAKTLREIGLIVRGELERTKNQEKAKDQEVAENRIKTQLATAEASIQLSGAVFEENKGLAAAQSLIYAFEAAAGAAAETHGDLVTRIAAYATMFAFVIQAFKIITTTEKKGKPSKRAREAIGGTEAGGTFDTPENDRLALLGGSQSVKDFIRLTQEGMREGFRQAVSERPVEFAEATAGSAIGDIFNFWGNVYGGDPGLRQLSREIERAKRLDQPRRIG